MLLCVASELTDCGVVFCFNVFISASPVFVGLSFSLFLFLFFLLLLFPSAVLFLVK